MNRLVLCLILCMWALCACNASSTSQQTIQQTTPPRVSAESRADSVPGAAPAAAPAAAPVAVAHDAADVADPSRNQGDAQNAPMHHEDIAAPQAAAPEVAADDAAPSAADDADAADAADADVAPEAVADDVAPEAVAADAAPDADADPADDDVAPDMAQNAAADDGASHRIDSMDPLSAEQVRLLDEIPWDADPAVLNAVIQKNEGGHFLYSDELHPELFLESIQNRGGVYIGIGTDQGYMFMGWQRPTLAFLVDYDPWVIVLHRIYFMLFKQCDDGDCILAFFQNKSEAKEFLKTPEAKEAIGARSALAIEVYRSGARSIAHELRSAKKMREKNFMNDAETYNYIKQMILSGRARTFQANLLGDKTFLALSETLRALGVRVSTLYLSNAEQYWNYSSQFKRNMAALPVEDDAIVMRTMATKLQNRDYRYSVQPFPVFRAWLEHPKGRNARQIVEWGVVENPTHFPFTVSNRMPPAPKEETKK